MSLNWREIDAVLDELDLEGCHVQQVIQPDFRNLYLGMFVPGRRFQLRVCLETGVSRIHATTDRPGKPDVRQRFAQLLNARIRGARIVEARQLNADRIVRFRLLRAGETTLLWIRLWGGAANCILTDAEGRIIDAFFRRPGRGEVSGGTYLVEEHPFDPDDPKLARFVTRWQPPVSEAVRAHYDELEQRQRRDTALAAARRLHEQQDGALRRRLTGLGGTEGSEDPQRSRTIGDLIMANLHQISPGARWVEVEDYTRDGQPVTIELDPALPAHANAQTYYSRAQRTERRSRARSEEEQNLESRLQRISTDLESLTQWSTADLERLATQQRAERRQAQDGEAGPGLRFESHGFVIFVGRNARENDELLRRHTRGNDLWMHTRDVPGGYVFVRNRPGKSVPLDVLLDAGNLALHFSRARTNGRADLYYTQVKHLRRAKEGPVGLVLPTHERNLHVVVDEHRISRLLGRDRS